MARTPSETMTGREAQVMDAVWRLGEATADEVRGALPAALHDSTVRTLLRVLESKGYLGHEVARQDVRVPCVDRARQRPAPRSAQRAGAVLRGLGGGPGAEVDRG